MQQALHKTLRPQAARCEGPRRQHTYWTNTPSCPSNLRLRHPDTTRCCAAEPSPSTSGGDDGLEAAASQRGATYTVYGSRQQAGEPVSFPLSAPLLPFTAQEVLTPGATKTLHLYEARYIALLEEVLASEHKMFVHAVIEQPNSAEQLQIESLYPGSYIGSNFVLKAATLVKVVHYEAAPIGAVVRIQAEGRLRVAALTQLQPFISATVLPLCDEAVQDAEALEQGMEQLRLVMRDASNLAAKFKGRESAGLSSAMYWSACTSPPAMHGLQEADRALEAAFRLSFAALQVLPRSDAQEQAAMMEERLKAMAFTDTQERLQRALEVMSEARGMLAAKVALMSLGLG